LKVEATKFLRQVIGTNHPNAVWDIAQDAWSPQIHD
jgi:hypothetical protein